MILIVTALRIEAAPFIDYYKLKRDMTSNRHELYKNNDDSVMLLITRTGKLPAAIALTEFLATAQITPNDYMVNVGICGCCSASAIEASGTVPVYLCNSITDHDTGKCYYPDMLLRHPFLDAGVETFSVAVTSNLSPAHPLVDMEASALFEAGNYHFMTHQMYFIKIPSDILNPDAVAKEKVTAIMKGCTPIITTWLDRLLKASGDTSAGYPELQHQMQVQLSDDDLELLKHLTEGLRLSVTMKEQLKQLFIYKKLKDGDLSSIDFTLPEGTITNQKRKILFEELRERFL